MAQIGMDSGRSAITWLEAAPWVRVWSIGRPGSSTSRDEEAIRTSHNGALFFLDQKYNYGAYGKRFNWIQVRIFMLLHELNVVRDRVDLWGTYIW
jgi:hypothetical protein